MKNVADVLLEPLAEAEHAGWARWMDYLFSECIPNDDGSFTIPPERAQRWMKQLRTPYAELSEPEKEADRDEVRKILPVIQAAVDRNAARDASTTDGS